MKKQKRLLATIGIAGMLALTACAATDTVSTAPTTVDVADDYTFAQPLIDEEPEEIHTDIGIVGGPALLSPEDVERMWANMFDPETVQIIVQDEVIAAPTPFTDNTAGTVMLPLIAIAEALGYVVVDNGEEVIVGPGSIVTAGENSYFRGRETPRELTSAPIMRDGIMFVPWEFFHEILSATAFVEDGDIHVVELEF